MIEMYEKQIREYVEQNLDMALLASYSEDTYDRINKERENLKLYRSMILNPELREIIITRIVNYAVENTKTSFKAELAEAARESYYINSVKSFLTTYQMVLLAKKFNKEIQMGKTR